MRKNTCVHIDDNTFACKHQRYIVLTSRIQKDAKVNNKDSRYFDVF